MVNINRNPEQKARDRIDVMLAMPSWKVQPKNKIDFTAGAGTAVREYRTDIENLEAGLNSFRQVLAGLGKVS